MYVLQVLMDVFADGTDGDRKMAATPRASSPISSLELQDLGFHLL
ncbi:hypothetical protein [Tateyamaria pelophila]|nr:hypothetical protein [Tateyamaria pelophila]